MSQQVFCGNNIELLKQYPDNYFDSIVTDPPYGLGKEPNAEEMLKAWVTEGYLEVKGSGFMGKEWDAFVPQPIFWKEVFRVLKHGGHVIAFYGTRTYDWGVMAMRLAGFEVRDSLQWVYGSGFPKSYNIAKGIEGKLTVGSSNTKEYKLMQGEKSVTKLGTFNKMEKEQGVKPNDCTGTETTINHILTTEEAKQWDGWGSALKPAVEPIVLARKPLEKGLSIAENVLKWGVGGINIDGCRVGFTGARNNGSLKGTKGSNSIGYYKPTEKVDYGMGRFPANLILTHHPDCECVGIKKVKAISGGCKFNSAFFSSGESNFNKNGGIGDENGEETIEDWSCHEDCPIRIMDEQSGESKSSKSAKLYVNDTEGRSVKNGASGHRNPESTYNDKGGASRFFYCAKASKSERNKGLEGFEEKQTIGGGGTYNEEAGAKYGSIKAIGKNFHPTVKPIKLMQYLVRLVTPPNGIVLDPFCGSGTTGVACKLEGFNFIGLELDTEYTNIAQARIDNYSEELEQKKQTKQQTSTNDKPSSQQTLF